MDSFIPYRFCLKILEWKNLFGHGWQASNERQTTLHRPFVYSEEDYDVEFGMAANADTVGEDVLNEWDI